MEKMSYGVIPGLTQPVSRIFLGTAAGALLDGGNADELLDGAVERGVNAFVLNPSDQVTPSFRFPRPTFIYGEQVDEYEQKYLDEMGSTVEQLGQIESALFQAIKDCVKKAKLLRRKYKNLL